MHFYQYCCPDQVLYAVWQVERGQVVRVEVRGQYGGEDGHCHDEALQGDHDHDGGVDVVEGVEAVEDVGVAAEGVADGRALLEDAVVLDHDGLVRAYEKLHCLTPHLNLDFLPPSGSPS